MNQVKATVFCASSRKSPQKYIDATIELASVLIQRNIHVYYGGGAVGLMGVLADEYIKQNGTITGVIPKFMVEVEWAHPKVEDMLIVKDMHERKKKLVAESDIIIALPGGTGTLEELMEVVSLKRLGKLNKPIIIINTDHFYDPLDAFLQKMVSEHFIRKEHLKLWQMIPDCSQLWSAIKSSGDWNEDAINIAGVY